MHKNLKKLAKSPLFGLNIKLYILSGHQIIVLDIRMHDRHLLQ